MDRHQALQSMVITKQPEIGGAVGEHNDSTFLYTDPPTALGFWIALQECTTTNGALSFLPGSHLTVPLTKRFVRLAGGGTGFEPLHTTTTHVAPNGKEQYILQTCNPGTVEQVSPQVQWFR
jgi:phytanoyl-CoA hydroxylase